MPRGGEEVRRRLRRAALELFRQRGYDQVTAAEIAARAGVTERTFFRHFPDKREVLFEEEPLRSALVSAVAAAPTTLSPMEALSAAFRSAQHLFEDNRSYSGPRRKLIAGTPALREREHAKAAALIAALAEALTNRGVEGPVAALAAQAGMAVLSRAVNSWLDDASGDLGIHLEQAFTELHALSDVRASKSHGGKPRSRSRRTPRR